METTDYLLSWGGTCLGLVLLIIGVIRLHDGEGLVGSILTLIGIFCLYESYDVTNIMETPSQTSQPYSAGEVTPRQQQLNQASQFLFQKQLMVVLV